MPTTVSKFTSTYLCLANRARLHTLLCCVPPGIGERSAMANPRTVTTAAEVNGNQRLTNSPSLRRFGHESTNVNHQKAYGDQNRRQAGTEGNNQK